MPEKVSVGVRTPTEVGMIDNNPGVIYNVSSYDPRLKKVGLALKDVLGKGKGISEGELRARLRAEGLDQDGFLPGENPSDKKKPILKLPRDVQKAYEVIINGLEEERDGALIVASKATQGLAQAEAATSDVEMQLDKVIGDVEAPLEVPNVILPPNPTVPEIRKYAFDKFEITLTGTKAEMLVRLEQLENAKDVAEA